MDIPSLFMIPSAVSSGKVHSVFPNSTDADFDFYRDSSATRVNSQGLIETVGYYGSELVTNRTFDTDSNWSKGTGWTISDGKANVNATNFTDLYQTIGTVAGKTYKISFEVSNYVSGSVKLILGYGSTPELPVLTATANGVYELETTPNTTNPHVVYISTKTATTNLSIDNVSVKEVLGDRARLNYEIEGGLINTKPSLLLEPQSTNLVTYSEDFSNSAWTKNNVTVTSGFTSPDGTNSAYLMTDDVTDSKHGVYDIDILSQDGNIYTRSVFVKKGTARYVVLSARHIPTSSGTSWIYDFDSNNWALTGSSGAGQSIKNYANGWVRLSVSHISNSNFNNDFSIGISSGATVSDASYSGSGDTLYIWGAQIEQQSYATSYIPTNGSTQTRAAETCNGAGTSSIFESSEGILYAEIAALANNADTLRWINLNNGATTNRVAFYYRTDENQLTYLVSSGTTQVFSTITLSSASSFIKIAAKWKANDFALWVDGVKVVTDTSGNSPVGLNQLSFDNGAGGSNFYGKLRDIRVYNTKEMTDSEVDILLNKITS